MGVLRTALAVTGYSTIAATASFYAITRHCKILPVSPSDYLLNHTLYARYNPNNAPVTQDNCVRKVPLKKIRADLLVEGEEGKLVEAFCAGLWGGVGYAYQRRYLDKKYRGPETATQLWDRKALKTSTYPVGTQITDHFEVVAKTSNSIIVRCGDSPRKVDVRDSDGLFEMFVDVKQDEGVAEFGLKSVFYNGLAVPESVVNGRGVGKEPMSPWIQWLHAQYDKVLMETALRGSVMK